MLVYKYKGFSLKKKFQRELKDLEMNRFWASNFKKLNDPFETVIDSNYLEKCILKLGRLFINIDSKKDIDFVNNNTREVLSFDRNNGIFSLSRTKLDELLWVHYANDHKGFCIEYDLDLLLTSDTIKDCFIVSYSAKPKKINFLDIFRKRRMMKKNGGNKSLNWKYEKEIRIVTESYGHNYYRPSAVKSIYFGISMKKDDKESIVKSLKGKNINYYQIYPISGTYKLEYKKIDIIKE